MKSQLLEAGTVRNSVPANLVPNPVLPDLLNIRQTCWLFGSIHPASLYRGIRAGRFPRPVKVGPGTSRWLRHEVEACLAGLVDRRAQ